MTRIVLVRHGQTDWNFARRIQGSSDIALNDVGRRQARTAADALADRTWSRVYTSPLSRAAETAAILAECLGLPEPVAVPDLAERAYGAAEGLTGDEAHERYPDGIVPGKESTDALTERALRAISRLAEHAGDEPVLAVTHGGVIGALVRSVEGDLLPEGSGRHRIGNGSAHAFDFSGGALTLVELAGTAEDLDLVAERTVD
ncbi:histidine phosphatase family protein [Planctomonas psychrotolerans]|uniref:histidine phosphatase family protein n=1 Tax=Planctomonas psychrotolerans TaxID=2528712 RepID=UPI00123A2222|nr:histidine phosphatase family protein [Planctomonas psychrotolerans]